MTEEENEHLVLGVGGEFFLFPISGWQGVWPGAEGSGCCSHGYRDRPDLCFASLVGLGRCAVVRFAECE